MVGRERAGVKRREVRYVGVKSPAADAAHLPVLLLIKLLPVCVRVPYIVISEVSHVEEPPERRVLDVLIQIFTSGPEGQDGMYIQKTENAQLQLRRQNHQTEDIGKVQRLPSGSKKWVNQLIFEEAR